jgi:hypothetical protein
MFKVISVVALASTLCGCASSDQGKLSSESAKPRGTQATHAARVTSDTARLAKISGPQIVLGAAY